MMSQKSIKTREDFIEFMNLLAKDYQLNKETWENIDVKSYLESVESWVEDMDGYYDNMGLNMPEDIDWNFIATLFYVGKIYE